MRPRSRLASVSASQRQKVFVAPPAERMARPIVPKPTGDVPAATVDVDDVGADVDAAVVDAAVVGAAVGAGAVVGACVVGAVVGGRVVAAVGRDDAADVVLAPVEEDDGARDEDGAMVVVEVRSA